MLKNYTPKEYYTAISYELCFDDGCNNGYGFPCDENGKLLDGTNECAMENYKFCMENPNKFVRYNKVIKHERRTWNDPHGTCFCGNEVYLYNDYQGACQCEKCGRWYNLFGQELLPPDQWEDDYEY